MHDQYVFDRFFEDINKTSGPFFKALFTLSSHEPFDVPGKAHIKGDDEESRFLNSLCYTDSCLGQFIENCKKKDWWGNTLVLLVADHGTRLPGYSANYDIIKYRIPHVWIGGALNKNDTVINTYASQTDIVKTILMQLGQEASQYRFSKNIFSPGAKSFSYYSFNNGFGYVAPNCGVVYNNATNSCILNRDSVTGTGIHNGKAYLQTLMKDFHAR